MEENVLCRQGVCYPEHDVIYEGEICPLENREREKGQAQMKIKKKGTWGNPPVLPYLRSRVKSLSSVLIRKIDLVIQSGKP